MREPRSASPLRFPPLARRRLGVLLLGLLLSPAATLAVQVREIPSPRPTGWSVDLTGRVPKATLAAIDRLGNEVQAKNGAELAVVVVGTTSGVPSHAFATDLFNIWQVGQRGQDNGVLVFVALDDRRIEIVVGRGLSSPSLAEASAAILSRDMVPRLRQNDAGGAVLAGARAAARDLLGVPSLPPSPPPPLAAPGDSVPSTSGLSSSPSPSAPHDAIQSPQPAPPDSVPPVAVHDVGPTLSTAWVLLAFVLVLGPLGWLAYRIATRPRRCDRCGSPQERLSPEEGAAALPFSPVEATEARLGSVTTVVYRCSRCGELDKVRHSHPLAGYHHCPDCTGLTVSKRRWTVRQATYDLEGLVQIDWRCQHCPYESSSTAPVPRLVHADNSGLETAAFFAGSSDSSSDASGSSGSDSGFGGGHSSGDGASGSW